MIWPIQEMPEPPVVPTPRRRNGSPWWEDSKTRGLTMEALLILDRSAFGGMKIAPGGSNVELLRVVAPG